MGDVLDTWTVPSGLYHVYRSAHGAIYSDLGVQDSRRPLNRVTARSANWPDCSEILLAYFLMMRFQVPVVVASSILTADRKDNKILLSCAFTDDIAAIFV